ncbi:amidohydrolase family protein [Hoylesella saccharolytica F0055]|uniref:Amidohydrolase family protein n=1 Tax=Hoylesella saccharolytica F0055 TaxID=1127699 RepID=L1N8I7_9BACT|nr:dihydroorotase [Hoylesella saccharolytica]EKX99650.1 amidohydrolase family protein [Hoylesella saccharolytica F0055]
MTTLLYGGIIVNEGRTFKGSVVIENDFIAAVIEGEMAPRGRYDKEVDATGSFILPGIIDEHVHFREPGLTQKGDIESESRAAAYGGVTSFFDMPNTNPQTTTLDALKDKWELGRQSSHVNYSFFFGATNGNIELFDQLNPNRIPGIKLFMGSSTGNMLVDKQEALEKIFKQASLPVMAHCEDTDIINRRMVAAKQKYGEDPPIEQHPVIRSEEACYRSTELAVLLAEKYGTRLHVAHLTTARELELFGKNERVTAEATVSHLLFSEKDYGRLGTLIKCNPAIKCMEDRQALRQALTNGRISAIGTDHAPHLLKDKEGGCTKAASGMPMVQFSLVSMLELVDEDVLSVAQMVNLMCHQPARLFDVRHRGFLRKGYKADIAVVKRGDAWTVTEETIQSKCKWSPVLGHRYHWKVVHTFCNGHQVLDDKGRFDTDYRGEEIAFR